MQRFRLLSAVVTITLTSSAVVAHADDGTNDTAAQATARAALLQQMNQMDGTQLPGSSNSVTAPAEPSNPPPAEQTPPVTEPALPPLAQHTPPPITQHTSPPLAQPTPQFSTNVPVVTPPVTGPAEMPNTTAMPETEQMSSPTDESNTSNPQEKAQASTGAISVPPPSVLTNEMEEYPVNPPMTPLPPPQTEMQTQTETQMPTATEHPVPVPMSDSGGMWPTPVPSNSAAQQLPPGMAQEPSGMAQEGRSPSGANLILEPKGTNSAALQVFTPITAPPLPISPEKQSELQSLLARYMANQITPVQYQEERARIMAGP